MASEPIIEFRDAVIYQNDHLVFPKINLDIHRGEFVYMIGKVGSGKSSIIKTLNAELPLRGGEIRVGKFFLSRLKHKEIPYLRRSLGIVFQDFQMLSDRSIEKNLEFVLRATGWKNKHDIEQRIAEVLKLAGLEHKGYKMPHQISGGEQQRMIIARALLNNPEVILADEPTGNLDPDTSVEILKLLLDISSSGRTVVMATHNYTLLKKYPSRTLRCENGTITDITREQEIDLSSLEQGNEIDI